MFSKAVCLFLLTSALALTGCGDSPDRRVVVLGIDSLDPETIDLLVSEGQLPNLAKLRTGGAYGRLRSSRPILSPIIWTTIATGKSPTEHGIGHFVASSSSGERLPVTSQMRKVEAIWNIASRADKQVGVVGWWASWPAERVNGTLISDHAGYHFLFEEGLGSGPKDDTGVVHPAERTQSLLEKMKRPDSVRYEDIVPEFVHIDREEFARPFDFKDDLSHFKWAWSTAESYRGLGRHLLENDRPDLTMVYIEGVDSSSHLFGHLFRAEGLEGELAEQHARYGGTVEAMYRYADSIVGEYLGLMDENTTLVVLSDHGFQLGLLHDDPSKTRDLRRVSEKYHRIEGIVYLYGNGVVPGTTLREPELLDIAPTLLTLLDLPAAQDMPGRVLAEGLAFEVPARSVATYEVEARKTEVAQRDSAVDPAIVDHLAALGYIDTPSPQNERNLANIHFAEGNYEEALAAYRAMLEARPQDPSLHSSLAGTLGALGRYDEALEAIAVAVELDPINPEPYHNRAVIYERQGKPGLAVQEYRTALRYRPDYEPARNSLARLGAPLEEKRVATPERSKARKLVDTASLAARRGAYEEANRLLDEAEALDPTFALVHHYRANVAYLRGDREAAAASLARAIALEPDNALFRENLSRLGTAPDAD